MPTRAVRLNGSEVTADYESAGTGTSQASEPLLYWLRDRLDQHGPRFGCGIAQCGACTVLLDGAATRSCVRQMHTVADEADIRTLDGLAAPGGEPHPLQRAFTALQAAQCGFCANGLIMGSLAWLESRIAAGNNAVPTEQEIKDFLSGASPDNTRNYLCRCGTHTRIVAAVGAAAKEMIG
ncbi:(2Fe-2S)-binding protein [Actinacidiphila acididurans]|uniref:(2Fe-2S)-binding protein n=1 Tax=Actinacidiphila acididurans TaxID=2784346 RepID=A0ABS2TZI9_9ACTN|nr:2Fe-2S iron-sulfur cluster-binding protein [Actinacidiphila acididurans]MBM9507911.1 (2Fe-2S)-binding protein [Actinacidiphila acididurans]